MWPSLRNKILMKPVKIDRSISKQLLNFYLWIWSFHGGEYVDVIALMMEAVRVSEASVCNNETTRRYISEGCHLHVDVGSQRHCVTNYRSLS
jgi:hypothetical protein